MADKPMIQLKDVSKVYDNGTVGLKDIKLTINKGEFVVVVGLSGAGKSTLLRSINRLHNITSGDILIDGKSITKAKGKNLRNLRRDIGMIFQNFNLVKRSSVLRNVLVGRVAYYPTWKTTFNLFSKEDKQKAYEALQKVDLADKVYARADELSGGQQQRVAIARVLMQDPKIILADEPTASLDPQTSIKVMDDLKMLNEKYGMTVLTNLHSVELARKFGQRVIGIRAGQVVYDGKMEDTPESVFTDIYNGGDGNKEAK
ncbi:Glutamine transport ATP-binding protein GlnQ [Lactobacillus helveticus]|uniref:phosphonate ABC transporter ATP-binding protein n=1 Tax=Lactobacillus helveticus TaxID=1587 RepID=UPI00156289D8|nr:phosphonate ABC transporter ATP-binding protein [Lactobacillus helveticus]NRO05441.1 Glutamine transport ATP-binding protein GlnQ [Lactobacillus helveticus]NRO26793.1 Glutamine transport ATP-binding protein GlnQ [Lactobacillus helveticus]NRO62296.1 Glutamine transport ATP-binding protein GlnQ [Lactobacillus helveticus]